MVKNYAGVSVLEPSGDLGRREIANLCNTIDSLIQSEWVRVVLNLENVTHLHYAEIQKFIHVLFSLKLESGDLRLAKMNPYHKQLFQFAGVNEHFESFDTLEEAVLSYVGP